MTESPAGLAAWMLDHDADAYDKMSRALAGGQPSGGLTRDHILGNITLRSTQPHLLPRSRPRRSLRRLGGATAVRDRGPGGVQVGSLARAESGARHHAAGKIRQIMRKGLP